MHGRTGAQVDYFATVTGVPREEIHESARQPGVSLRVLRVDELAELLTCCDCWGEPAVQSALHAARSSGALPRA
jgi:hypothetical protein